MMLQRLRGAAAFLGGAIARRIPLSYAANGALTIQDGVHHLTKAGVGAYTLAAPTAAQQGTIMQIVNDTANAHVVTATGLVDNGVVGGAKNTMTFGAFIGSSITLIATANLRWAVLSINVVSVA